MIRHIVTWKLLAEEHAAREADIGTIVDALQSLPPVIAYIRELTVGPNIADFPDRWDLALVVDFDSEADLAAYRAHPEHRRVADIVRQVVSERASIDFIV